MLVAALGSTLGSDFLGQTSGDRERSLEAATKLIDFFNRLVRSEARTVTGKINLAGAVYFILNGLLTGAPLTIATIEFFLIIFASALIADALLEMKKKQARRSRRRGDRPKAHR